MGRKRYTKKDQHDLVRLTALPIDQIEAAKDDDEKPRRLPKKYDTDQQKTLIDKMLDRIPELVDRSKDPQGFQQITNSMAQLIRLRQELDSQDQAGGDDADKMDATAQRARDKMLGFARDNNV